MANGALVLITLFMYITIFFVDAGRLSTAQREHNRVLGKTRIQNESALAFVKDSGNYCNLYSYQQKVANNKDMSCSLQLLLVAPG